GAGAQPGGQLAGVAAVQRHDGDRAVGARGGHDLAAEQVLHDPASEGGGVGSAGGPGPVGDGVDHRVRLVRADAAGAQPGVELGGVGAGQRGDDELLGEAALDAAALLDAAAFEPYAGGQLVADVGPVEQVAVAGQRPAGGAV